MWGELASHKILFNPPPQARLGTWCPALMLCMSSYLNVVSIDVCGFLFMGVGCWVNLLSSVLYTMVSCTEWTAHTLT